MIALLRLIGVALVGGILHLLTYKPTHALGERHGGMARESIGTIALWPMILFVLRPFKLIDERTENKFTLAYYASALAMGVGVYVGHWIDRLSDDER